jgi:GNAT superfamily N-acetyltransferase
MLKALMPSHRSIALKLPDLPRWVESRSLLLEGFGEIFGFAEKPDLSLVLRDPDARSIFVIGRPIEKEIEAAIEKNGHGNEVIAAHEQAAWLAEILPGWKRAAIIVHHLPDMHRLPEAPTGAPSGAVGFLDPAVIPQLAIEDDLKQELISGAEQSSIAATFVEQEPVSFCYAGALTESLWDISIDTVPEQQRKGYAALCVSYMIRYLHGQGRHPVWQALEDNPASWRLAQKLGFMPVDELVLFTP